MKAFFVNARERKNGNTVKLLKSAMEGAAAEGEIPARVVKMIENDCGQVIVTA